MYSSDEEEKEESETGKSSETGRSRSKKPISEPSASEELIVDCDNLPGDGQSGAAWKSNIQSSALDISGIKFTDSMKKLDKALFHALKRCVTGPVSLHFDRVTKCSYMQVTLLMYKDIFHSGPRAKLNTLGISMLDIPWNGNVEEWKAAIMDRHMKLRTVKFNIRELSLFGVLMSSQK